MFYRLLADLVLIVHLAFVLFVVLGGFLALRRPRMKWVHLAAVSWGAGIEFVGLICPLTYLETYFRRLGGEAGYEGDFIDHYVAALLYPSGLTRGMQIGLGCAVLAINLCIYGYLYFRARRAPSPTRNGTAG